MPATPTTNSDDEETPLVASASRMTSSLRYSYGSPSMRQGKIVAVKQRVHHISNRLRWITNGTGLLCVFLFSGIIFGWAPLKLMLQREGQYSGLCDGSEDVGVVDGGEDTLPPPCVAQTVRFNRIFTAAQFFLSFASLPVGFFLDHSSKVIHFSVAAALEIAGLLLLAQADYRTETEEAGIPFLDNFVIGYTLLALGGGMSMMGAFPASFLLQLLVYDSYLIQFDVLMVTSSGMTYLLVFCPDHYTCQNHHHNEYRDHIQHLLHHCKSMFLLEVFVGNHMTEIVLVHQCILMFQY